MKKILSFVLVCAILTSVLLVGTFSASAANSGKVGSNISWTYADKTLTISGSGKMTIEGSAAPWKGLKITSVVIKEGVTFIDRKTFKDLDELKQVTIPLSMEPISPEFSSKVSSIDVYYAGNNADWAYIKNCNISIKTVMHYGKQEVDLNVCGKIGKNAYWNLESDKTTVSITGTGGIDSNSYEYAWNCPKTNTKTVKIKEGITAIGVRAFTGFDKLTKVELPKSLQVIGNNAFDDCKNLTDITYSGTKSDWANIQIYENVKFTTATIYYAGDRTTDNKRDPNAVDVFVNNVRIEAYQPAIIVKGSTMVPLRAICEALKCNVNWNPDTRTAQIQNQATIVSVQIGNSILSKVDRSDVTNVERVSIPNPPIIYNNSTLVPARAISEALHADVVWDAATRSVYITLEYDSIGFYSKGVAVASKDGKYGLIDENREIVLPIEYSEVVLPKAESRKYNKYGYIMIRDASGKCGIVHRDGTIIVRPTYGEIVHDANGIIIDENEYIMVRDALENKYGYINLKGKVVIQPRYEEVKEFSEGLAAVKQNGVWGFIKKNGMTAIQFGYADAHSFVGKYAVVKKNNNKWGTIDKDGKIVVPIVYDKIFDDFSDGYSIVQNEGKYGAIDKEGFDALNPPSAADRKLGAPVDIKLTLVSYEAARQALILRYPELRVKRK